MLNLNINLNTMSSYILPLAQSSPKQSMFLFPRRPQYYLGYKMMSLSSIASNKDVFVLVSLLTYLNTNSGSTGVFQSKSRLYCPKL